VWLTYPPLATNQPFRVMDVCVLCLALCLMVFIFIDNFQVKEQDKVLCIKEKVELQLNVPVVAQRLVHRGKPLSGLYFIPLYYLSQFSLPCKTDLYVKIHVYTAYTCVYGYLIYKRRSVYQSLLQKTT